MALLDFKTEIGYIVNKVQTAILAEIQEAERSVFSLQTTTIDGITYLYGHYKDIKTRLQIKDQSGPLYKGTKYPLIALFQDFREQRSKQPGIQSEITVQMLIAYFSKADRWIEDRKTLVFDPILYPIYNELLRQMELSGLFTYDSIRQHVVIERPNWGNPDKYGTNGNILNDALDALELNFTLKMYRNKPCSTNKTNILP